MLLGILLERPQRFDYGVRTLYDWPFKTIRLHCFLLLQFGRTAEKSRNPDYATPAGYHT